MSNLKGQRGSKVSIQGNAMNNQNYETTKMSDGDIQSTGVNDTLKIDELDHVFGAGY